MFFLRFGEIHYFFQLAGISSASFLRIQKITLNPLIFAKINGLKSISRKNRRIPFIPLFFSRFARIPLINGLKSLKKTLVLTYTLGFSHPDRPISHHKLSLPSNMSLPPSCFCLDNRIHIRIPVGFLIENCYRV